MNYKHELVEFLPKLPAVIWNQDMTGIELYTPSHWHRSLELNLVLSGQARGTVNGKSRTLLPGDILFVNSGELHSVNYIRPNDRALAVTILISYEFILSWFPDYEESFFDLEHHPEIMDELRDMIAEIGEIYHKKPVFWELEITGCLHRLLFLLISRTAVRQKASRSIQKHASTDTMRKAITYINQHYQELITLEETASYVGFSAAYFSRFFHKNMGVTFYRYLNNIRLHYALLDLLNRNATTNDCAYQNGFPNVKSFIETFKKTYHCTPGQYKKRYFSQQNLES